MDWQLVLLGVIAVLLFMISQRLDWILKELRWMEGIHLRAGYIRDNQQETNKRLEGIEAANPAYKLSAVLDELQAIKGELARIRRATLHQGPYEP